MMDSDIYESLRYSGLRTDILLELCARGRASQAEIADAVSARAHVVRWALVGAPPRYSRSRALVGLGLARAVGGRSRTYEATAAGVACARWVRRHGLRGRRRTPGIHTRRA